MITKRDAHFLEVAKTHAISSEKVSGARVGAIIVIKNRIISFGTNQYKTHPFQAEYSRNEDAVFLHAEVDCIKNALKRVNVNDLQKATMYIVRVKNETCDPSSPFILGLAKPCQGGHKNSGCMGAITNFGLKKVVYSKDDQTFEVLMRK